MGRFGCRINLDSLRFRLLILYEWESNSPLFCQLKFIEMSKVLKFIFIAFLFSCTTKDLDENIYFTEEDLPQPIKLVGRKYNIPEIINPRGLMIKDGLAVVFEKKNVNDNKFHVINLASGAFFSLRESMD